MNIPHQLDEDILWIGSYARHVIHFVCFSETLHPAAGWVVAQTITCTRSGPDGCQQEFTAPRVKVVQQHGSCVRQAAAVAAAAQAVAAVQNPPPPLQQAPPNQHSEEMRRLLDLCGSSGNRPARTASM